MTVRLRWWDFICLGAYAVIGIVAVYVFAIMPGPPSPRGEWRGGGHTVLLTDSTATLDGEQLKFSGVRDGRICFTTRDGCMTLSLFTDSAILRRPLRTLIDTGDVIAVLRR